MRAVDARAEILYDSLTSAMSTGVRKPCRRLRHLFNSSSPLVRAVSVEPELSWLGSYTILRGRQGGDLIRFSDADVEGGILYDSRRVQ